MRGASAHDNEKQRPPVSELTVALWCLVAMIAVVLFTLLFFGHMYDGA